MRAFVLICAVILLTSAQIARSSPLEIIENNEVPVENDSKSESYFSNIGEVEIIQNDAVNSDSLSSEKIDGSDENNDGYDDDDDDDDDDDEDDSSEFDPEMLERTIGIEISICEQNANIRYPLHTSHPSDCGKFYKCSNGRGFLMDCPAGEVWSVKLDRCDYEELVGCKVDGTHQYKLKKVTAQKAAASNDNELHGNESDANNGEFEIDPRCEGGDPYRPIHLPHSNDCTKFYKCYMGKAYVIKCPKGQHFNQRANRCDHASVARCSIVKIAASAASLIVPYMDISEEKLEKIHTIVDDADYMIADARCEVDEDDKFHPIHFAHPSNCQMFYKCFNNFAYKVSCPDGLHYNLKTQACDYPTVAKCKTNNINIQIAASVMEVQTPSIPDCTHGRLVNYGIQGTLTRYFQCKNGEVYLMECGFNEFFNPNNMKCDRLPYDQYQQQQQYQPYAQNQYSPNYNSYYPMWNNYPNWGMNSNYQNWGLNYPQQKPSEKQPQSPPKPPMQNNEVPSPPVQQPQIVVPDESEKNPQSPDFPSWLPQPNLNVNYPQFPSINQPHDDGHRTDGGFDFSVGKTNSRCPTVDDPSNPVHLSHENHCSKFYKCFNGRAFLMDCPEGQEFSDELQRCDYHLFANCDAAELMKRKLRN